MSRINEKQEIKNQFKKKKKRQEGILFNQTIGKLRQNMKNEVLRRANLEFNNSQIMLTAALYKTTLTYGRYSVYQEPLPKN